MQMVTLNKDDIYQGPLVLVNHNYPIANNYQITNCSTAKDSTISLEKTAMEMLTKALQEIKAEDLIINKEVQENIDLGEGYTNVALFGVDSRDGNLGEGNL